jgi:MATE family multidrug resistance protein
VRGEIPEARVAYSVVGLMNEHQLALGETTTGGRRELRNREGLLDYDALMLLTLQRAKTSREAIDTIDRLVNEHGYGSGGETISIADPREAWMMEIIGKGCVYLTLRCLSEGLGATRPTLYFALLGLPVTVVANRALMYGELGLPALGAVGCGWATALVWWAECLGIVVYVGLNRRYRDLELFGRLDRPRWRPIAEILGVGLPIGVSIFVEGSLFAAVALVIGSLGTEVVAGHQVALNFAAITFMVPLGLAMAVTVRVGNAAGRRDPAGVRFAALVGVGMGMLWQVAGAAVMLAFPRQVAAIYTDDPRVIAVAVELLFLAAVFQLSDGLQVGSAGALRGIKDTRVPMAITVVAYWLVGLPCGYWLAFGRRMGAAGMWIGLIAGLTLAAVLLVLRFVRVTRPAAAAPGR